MSQMNVTPEQASTLSVLVNTDRIRSSIKRLFHNNIAEVLSEIFQNGQRSGATTVDINTTDNAFTIQDNGHGLLDGIDGFHTLLKLAESKFDSDTIDDQDPMGVGIISLLTHDQINEVTFSSAFLELTVDTKKWWSDPEYYSVWYQRIVTLKESVQGLRISATCAPKLIDAIHLALQPKDILYTFSDEILQSASPAQGYKGILTITLNGDEVRTSLPNWTKLQDKLISTSYNGSKLTNGYNESSRRSSILWYGQLISLRGLDNHFDYHLEVTSGRPVNPLSPSRAGIIQDTAYNQLIAFIKQQIFDFVFDETNRSKIKPAHVEACFLLDSAYTTANSPYLVAESIKTTENPNSLEDFNCSSDLNTSPRTLFTYRETPLLLDEGVTIQLATDITEAVYGLPSFLAEIGPAFTLRHGDESKLSIGTLWWKPEGEPQHEWFYKPGVYGISYERQKPPKEWLRITKTPVFAFSESSSYDAYEVDFVVGNNADMTDIMSFLSNGEVWAGFSANDESDYDPQEDSYRNSVSDIIRSIIGTCVPHHFTLYELSHFLKDQSAPIISISYHYKSEGKFVNPPRIYKSGQPNSGTMTPSEITVKTATGEKVRLKLY